VTIIKIKIDKIISSGDGLGFLDGKAHFVPQALPNEIVEVQVIENKKGFNRCKLLNIIKASEFRTEPICKYYNICGGCNMQHTIYNNQITIKKDIIQDIFRRNGKIELEDFEFVESKDINYRNRIQLHRGNSGIGFKRRQSNEVVEINNCPLLVEKLNHFILNKSYPNEKKITLFSNGINNFIGGKDSEAHANILGKDIYFNPGGFFQSNISILPKLIDLVNRYVVGPRVMDLYCGVGLFSAFLPESIQSIVAVELDSRVKPFIDRNTNGRNITFFPMSLEEYILRGEHDKSIIDTIIVDPPRKGLSDEVRNFLKQISCKRVIYISCDPTTMARDIKDLNENGYKLIEFKCLDFYPNTNHIESFGVLDFE